MPCNVTNPVEVTLGKNTKLPEGEALRDDENFKYAAAWEYKGDPSKAKLHKEELVYENIEVKTRSYK